MNRKQENLIYNSNLFIYFDKNQKNASQVLSTNKLEMIKLNETNF
jgi:hypothetical protein